MRATVASEWLKLRRPGMLGALAAGTLALCFGTVVVVATAGSDSRGMAGATRPTVWELTSSHGLADALGVSSTLVGVVALAVSAAAWATSTRTARSATCSRGNRAGCGSWPAAGSASLRPSPPRWWWPA
jgi:hypothetical protein